MTENDSTVGAGLGNDAASTTHPCIILFYKYHPLSDDLSIVELYRLALENLCRSLNLRGRILVGCSEHRSEGINGTLSGTKSNLATFVKALGKNSSSDDEASLRFQTECKTFYEAAKCHPLEMEESEFKWSELTQKNGGSANGDEIQSSKELFPDLNIKIVNELIGTGGVLSSIKIDECHKGYLTPQEWHERIGRLQAKKEKANEGDAIDEEEEDTILIDCRNTKECAIGNFVGSVDPLTTTFNQFPKWVDDHKHKLRNKSVLMYCTGGIRCEKASAYVRHAMGSSVKEVRHLKGGIHKYLEAYADEATTSSEQAVTAPLWRGKNFVFDGRGAHGPEGSSESNAATDAANSAISKTSAVGTCRYCELPYDSFDPHCVCTVCKEPILVCKTCQAYPGANKGEKSTNQEEQSNRPQHLHEYHCVTHKHLENCYFTNLEGFSSEELKNQLLELEVFYQDIAVGKKFRQRRKTLAKQRAKIEAKLKEVGIGAECVDMSSKSFENNELKCRNCGQVGCSGKCWGFHGLKRKRVLDQKVGEVQGNQQGKEYQKESKSSAKKDQNKRLKQQKELQKQKTIDEWIASGLTQGPNIGRDPSTGLRVPKPCVRILESTTKGKWCGKSLLKVLQTEFPNSFQARDPQKKRVTAHIAESESESTLRTLLRKGLIRVNGTPIQSLDEANDYKLKNMDIIDRIVLWHEPPIHLPSETIQVQKISIPETFLPVAKTQQENDSNVDNQIYVCDKPSTVPVHPAGPYLSNSLTMLVEAQEGLRPKTLIPCHRIDRVTSGMTICCTDSRVAKLIQTTMAAKTNNGKNDTSACLAKQYLARVTGRFPSNEHDDASTNLPILSDTSLARWHWTVHDTKTILHWNGVDSTESAAFLQVDGPIETVDPLNGVRKITSTGKTSNSLFQFIEYDARSDTSIIACTPVTGRSHQLRVHLEWLGYSIVNDIQYGGIPDTTIDPSAGVQRMVDNVRHASCTNYPSSLTKEQAQAARDVCTVCDVETEGRGPSSAFSPAQLLQGGHAICLHAYRYRMTFPSTTDKESNDVFSVDIKVDLPPWASHLRIGSSTNE